jgi:hypothetical protein
MPIRYPVTDMQATPSLDLVQDPPAPRVSKVGLVIGAAIGLGIVFMPDSPGEMLPGFNFLVWLPCFYVAICVHELAHLAAGMAAGMPPGGLVIGGFVMLKSGDHWTFRFNWRRLLGGGMALPLPEKGKFNVAGFAWMVAAGPIASVVSVLVCWLAFVKYGSGMWDWIGSFFWASAVGLLSLIPMSAGMNKSDAARLWMLWTKPEESRAWMATVAVQAESTAGVRPREWDSTLVEQMLQTVPDGAEGIFRHIMAYYRRLDEKNDEAACGHLESALAASAKSGKAVRQLLFLEAAEVNALIRHDGPKAHTWLERALKLRKAETIACVKGSISMCEARFEDGLREIAEAREFIVKKKLDSGLARFAKERLDDRERRCRQALSAPQPV